MSPSDILSAFHTALASFETDEEWSEVLSKAEIANPWFTKPNATKVLQQWRSSLSKEKVSPFISKYTFTDTKDKSLGIIMAGNIPAVGMHDLLMGLDCGYLVKGKLSSLDEDIPKLWVRKACEILPEISTKVAWVEKLKGVDFVIVTGSDNTARTFEYYFRETPKVLRKNRNSLAVLTGKESKEDMIALGEDIFSYFGLGCRSVTHLMAPEGYDFKPLIESWDGHHDNINHNKYYNNYHYHKALLLLDLDPHIDFGYGILHESDRLYSPVGTIHYSYYKSDSDIESFISEHQNEIQCIVGKNYLPFGSAQKTELWDFADNVDTVKALLEVN